MTSKRLLFGGAVLAALGLAAFPASAAPRGAGGHGGAAVHAAAGTGAANFQGGANANFRGGMTNRSFAGRGNFVDRGGIRGVSSSRGFDRGFDRDRFARGFDRDRFARFDRDRFDRGRFVGRDVRFAGDWRRRGWGWGPGFGFGVGLAAADWDVAWGGPAYYDDYDTGPLFDVAPGYVGVGVSRTCTCGRPWW
jgi:hypothetical protein